MESDNTSSDQKTTLGCGTLILVALIVIFFSNRGIDEVETSVTNLKSKVENLETAIAGQTMEIGTLRSVIETQTAQIGNLEEALEKK